jgi:hypothetical protein
MFPKIKISNPQIAHPTYCLFERSLVSEKFSKRSQNRFAPMPNRVLRKNVHRACDQGAHSHSRCCFPPSSWIHSVRKQCGKWRCQPCHKPHGLVCRRWTLGTTGLRISLFPCYPERIKAQSSLFPDQHALHLDVETRGDHEQDRSQRKSEGEQKGERSSDKSESLFSRAFSSRLG